LLINKKIYFNDFIAIIITVSKNKSRKGGEMYKIKTSFVCFKSIAKLLIFKEVFKK